MYSKCCNFLLAFSVMGASLLGMGCAADVSRSDISADYQGTTNFTTEAMSAEIKRYDMHLAPRTPSLGPTPSNESAKRSVHQAKAVELARDTRESGELGSVNLIF